MTTIKKMMIGFTAGAILGILYAPAKGSKTRQKLSEVGNDIKQGWNDIADNINSKIDHLKDNFDNIADNTMDKIEGTQFEVNDKAGYL